jgi:hypothetical protein
VAVVIVVIAVVLGTLAAPADQATRPVATRQAITGALAVTRQPVKLLLLGDSIALTLGAGLGDHSATRYGVNEINKGTLGCELDDLPVELSGSVGPATPGCLNWRALWRQDIRRYRPDVVGLLIGRWEVSNHLYRGHWVHIGEPAWDAHLESELLTAIQILSAGGAKIVLFTMPYVDPPNKAADGLPFPENDPSRAAAFNHLLYVFAAHHRSQVLVINLNKMIDPDGHFQMAIDGKVVRWTDGVHITIVAGLWLQSRILPTVKALGLEAQSSVLAKAKRLGAD